MMKQVRTFPPLCARLGIAAELLNPKLKKRCFWRTSGTRCTHPFHAKRNPSPSDARRALPHQPIARNRLSVSSLFSPPSPLIIIISLTYRGTLVYSYPGFATTLGRLCRRGLWRDGHPVPLLRRVRVIPPRRARSPRSRTHSFISILMPQF